MNFEEQFASADRLYDQGKYHEAFERFLLLAQKGDTSAMTRVAIMYGEGQGVEYSFEQSVNWDMKAVAAGDRVALCNLGISYRRAGDVRSAKRWFEKALQAGDGEAAIELAKMYLISDLETERVKNFLKLALQGSSICEASRGEAQLLLDELTD